MVVAKAQLAVSSIFTDHMVLQQNAKVKIWGKAAAKEAIKLKLTFLKKTINLVADDKGNWQTDIATPHHGGPYEMVIEGAKNTIKIEDIFLGEVWLASGQSNMQFPLDSNSKGYNGPFNFKEEVKNANYPSIRQFVVKGTISRTTSDAQQGEWLVCKPENAKKISALAFFYARNLQQNLKVPIGIINSSWGGTNIEAWMSAKDLNAFESEHEKLKNITVESVKVNENYPSVLFNGMIFPFRKYNIKGVIWCQGENNINDPRNYAKKMESLIKGWRMIFEQRDLPFLYVQIAPFNYMGRSKQYFWGKDNSLGYLVEEQVKVLKISDVFMARTGDIGDVKNIHYRNKQEVGQRLSSIALKEVYNKNIAITNGPNVVKVKYLANKAIVYYDNIGNGLIIKGKTINGFELSEDGINFYPADAVLEGKNISVSCSQLSRIAAVRYCFKNTQEVNLFNSASLPALPFRTDQLAY
ncbi:sialate O-acetylesterase [Nubsella zeaxanthinifaciens]|uniref:sialate O-acetylesterase n=1 Tax=Nubsella zeaxanthinifaciens TaxID=392412 RepID=UPI0013002AFB|nr:sialate O-acetylesterase [Nubsella zeaxanthinifaciens]